MTTTLHMDQVQDLIEFLKKDIGFTVSPKEDSTLMKATATGMDIAGKFLNGIPASDIFMNRFATTLGQDVFLPKVIRDNPYSLIEVVPHEGQHAYRFQESKVTFAWLYLTKAADRAQEETDAYATGMCVRSWLTGIPPSDSMLQWILNTLVASYHLKPEDRSYAGTALMSHIQSIKDGIYMTHSARATVAFLGEKYPSLKGNIAPW